jgi:VWFA-related protein
VVESTSITADEVSMKRLFVSLVCLCGFVFGSAAAVGQQPDEQVKVRLMLIDVLVADEAGHPVRGLTQKDFQMTVRRTVKPIDTLDEICAAEGKKIPGLAPRTVLLFDYYRLKWPDRKKVVELAAEMLRQHKRPDEQVMIAALTDTLRVEQRFTADLEPLLDTLERMEYDATLATHKFDHLSGKQYFGNMATLFDVLAAYDGSKAVIMYSATITAPGATDALFRDLTTRAAIGRSVVYPAGLRGLKTGTPRSGDRVLDRLASDTGGQAGKHVTDATNLYGEIKREMDCRYSLGFYLDAGREQAPEDIVVSVAKPSVTVRYPAQVRLWSAEETRASRQRAAFADPEQFDHPLVRTVAYPAGPDSTSSWSTLVAVHAPLPIGPEGETLDISAELYRDEEKIADFFRRMDFEPPASGADVQPFTLFGEASVKKGAHVLKVVLSKPDEKQVVSSTTHFEIPEVPWGELMLRGPLLARVEKEGLAIRAREDVGVLLQETIGDQSFEPLTVHEISPSDTLLAGWQACRVKKEDPREQGAQVERMIVDLNGNAVHELPAVPLKLEGEKAVKCHRGLDKIEPGTLAPGEYTVEVAVTQGGKRVLEQSAPLLVD